MAALFQYVVSDLGMGFHFDGRIIGCGFDAPGIADFLDALQPSDASKRVNISGLDYTNFVMRTDIVNTCGKQIGTTVCLEGDKASEACAMGDILNIATIHSREEIGKALEAKNYKMMQRWPSTSSDVLDKLIVAVTGSKWRLLGLGVGLASSASSFLKRLLVGTGATLTYTDEEIVAAREALETAMTDGIDPLSYDYHCERQLRHFPVDIGLFAKAYQEYKDYSVIPYLEKEDKITDAERHLLQCVTVEKRAQGDWLIFKPSADVSAKTLDEWMASMYQLAQAKPRLLLLPARVGLFYYTTVKMIKQLEKRGTALEGRIKTLAEEIVNIKNSPMQAAVISIGCAIASADNAQAQNLWSLDADDLAEIEARAQKRGVEEGISTDLFGAKATGQGARAFAATMLIPRKITSEEGLLKIHAQHMASVTQIMMKQLEIKGADFTHGTDTCLLYTSPSPRDRG